MEGVTEGGMHALLGVLPSAVSPWIPFKRAQHTLMRVGPLVLRDAAAQPLRASLASWLAAHAATVYV